MVGVSYFIYIALFIYMSINRNQIEALRNGYIQKIGSGDYKVLNTKKLPILEQALAEFGLEFNDAIVANLEKAGAIGKGKLAEPSMPVITKFGTKYVLNLGYPKGSPQIEYFDYINKGVKGAKSGTPADTPYSFKNSYPNRKMAANIFSWLNTARKKASADNVATSKTEKKRQGLKKIVNEAQNKRKLAYAISSKIKSKGIEATKYFDNAVAQVFNKEFMDTIAYAVISDAAVKIVANITKETKGNK
jgi:peptidyl-tRNA hydrolase